MEKLGLSLTGPSPFVINMANQSPTIPLGQIKDYRINTGGEEYVVMFPVIIMHSTKDSFPTLLARQTVSPNWLLTFVLNLKVVRI